MRHKLNMFSGRVEKNMCPISLITIRMRDGADTQAGAVLFKLICLNTEPLIKRMAMSLFCLFNGNLHGGGGNSRFIE